MSKNIVFALLTLLMGAQWACSPKTAKVVSSSEPQAKVQAPTKAQAAAPITTEHGFRLVNHTNNTTPKATVGGSILVHVDTYVGDSLLGTTRAGGAAAREFIVPEAATLGSRVPFIYDASLMLANGDSATMYETIDSLIRPYIPASLASAKDVRYEIKVVDLKTKADKDKAVADGEAQFAAVQNMVTQTAKDYKDGKLKLDNRPSGLKVLIVEPGKGAPVKANDMVRTNYYGCLTDGKLFDNSFQRGETLDFTVGVGQMIPGFDEGVQLLNHGGKAYFFLPPALAYGDQGAGDVVPPNSELIFYVEVL